MPVNRDSGISGTYKGFVQLGPNSRNPSLIWIVEFEEVATFQILKEKLVRKIRDKIAMFSKGK